jgi:hypothetical protein
MGGHIFGDLKNACLPVDSHCEQATTLALALIPYRHDDFNSMPCALCLSKEPLKLSHIVPEFMFKHSGMYDAVHRFNAISRDPDQNNRTFQKGLRERLLCGDCEESFSNFEAYACSVLYTGTIPNATIQGDIMFLAGLEYRRLKLFFMSLLWRFAVTTLEAYRGMDLGVRHCERLRNLLVAGTPGDFLTYPCFITAVTLGGKFLSDFILPPSLGKIDGQHFWSVVVSGFLFTFAVANQPAPPLYRHSFLQSDGSMAIQIRDARTIEFLYDAMLRFAGAQKQRREAIADTAIR